MKIGFSFDALSTKDYFDGKHKFLTRLAKQMNNTGVIIDNKKPDVYIFLPGEKLCLEAKLNVVRVDGLIMNTRWNYKEKNNKILKSIKKSDALIYQGIFCKESYNRFLGVKKSLTLLFLMGLLSMNFYLEM